MGITFPGSQGSTGPRATGCSSRRSSCAAPPRRWPPPGVSCRPAGSSRGLRLPGRGAGRRADRRAAVGAVRARQGLARRSTASCSPATPATSGRARSGQTALLPLAEGPCPSCIALLDQLDGAAEHAGQRLNLAVVAKAPLPRVLTFAEERGWRRLRLLSSAANTYNRDYLAETAEGAQRPMLNVFHRDGDDDPPLLGLGALLRADRPRPGPPPRRHPRAGLEPVRPHPARDAHRLG